MEEKTCLPCIVNTMFVGSSDENASEVNLNTLRPRQNGRHFPDPIFEWIFLNENVRISIKISLKLVPKVPINNIPAFGSDNGLAPIRRQAIVWTNDG